METETVTTNPTPSPLDQAYKRYKDDLRTKITGAVSEEDFVKGIIEESISREKVGELKKQIITPEEFKYYYPRELPPETKLKRSYSEQKIGRYEGLVNTIQVLPNGEIISGGADGVFCKWKLKTDGSGYEDKPEMIEKCLPSVQTLQVLPNGEIAVGVGNKIIMLK